MTTDISAALKQIPLFSALTDIQIKKFAAVAGTESYPPSGVIIEENTVGKALYVIRRGEARVSKIDGETEATLGTLTVGEPFGEMSLVDAGPTSARVSAGDDGMEVIVIMRGDFEQVVKRDVRIAAKVYQAFTRTLTQRLRRTSSELATWKPDLGI